MSPSRIASHRICVSGKANLATLHVRRDIKTWMLLCVIYGSTGAGTITNFFPSVVGGLGYDNVTTLLLTAPTYVVAVAASLTNAWHADKTGERFLHIALPPVLAMVMYIIAAATTAFGPRYLFVVLPLCSNLTSRGVLFFSTRILWANSYNHQCYFVNVGRYILWIRHCTGLCVER